MYEGKIVAEAAVATPLDVRAELQGEREGSAAVGLLVLLVALPVLAVRVFAHFVMRDLRKMATLGRIVGGAVRDAR